MMFIADDSSRDQMSSLDDDSETITMRRVVLQGLTFVTTKIRKVPLIHRPLERYMYHIGEIVRVKRIRKLGNKVGDPTVKIVKDVANNTE